MLDLLCFISLIVKAVAEGFFDAVAVDVATAGDAPGADAEEDLDAVVGPLGDLGGFYASVEAGGQTCVAQGSYGRRAMDDFASASVKARLRAFCQAWP